MVPKNETDYIFDLDEIYLKEILIFSKKISSAIIKTVDCLRIGVSVVGLEVPHAHLHLIPFKKEIEMNFSNKRIKMTNDDFKNLQNQIVKNLN